MLREMAVGALIGMVVLGLPLACSRAGELPGIVRCQLDALRALPDDPMMATAYDAADLVVRVRVCHYQHPDGGQ